jgi:hypothetical protein
MSSHLTHQELVGFRFRTIGAQQMLRADRHLASCGLCRRNLRSAVPAPDLPALAVELSRPAHLSYEDLTACLDGTQDAAGREWTESHIAICSMCAGELADLRALDARVKLGAAARVSTLSPGSKTGLLAWLSDFFTAPQKLRFVGASAGLAALGVILLARIPDAGGAAGQSHSLFFGITQAGPVDSAGYFAGLALLLLGLAGIVYRLFK